METKVDMISQHTSQFLIEHDFVGDNFVGTPERVARAWKHFFERYGEKPEMKFFPSSNKDLIVMKGHIAWGFCPHHLLPVRYTFRIGYVPDGRVVGLSKLARLAEYRLAKMPLQEELTSLIVDDLVEAIKPDGAACIIEGYHLCAVMRGIKSEEIQFVTREYFGNLNTYEGRREFVRS